MTTGSGAGEPILATEPISAQDIRRAASTMEPVDDSSERITVLVDGNPYDPLALFARAAKVEPDRVRLRTALRTLAGLKFQFSDDDSPFDSDARHASMPTRPDERASPLPGADTDSDEQRGRPDIEKPTRARVDMTEDLAQQLQRFRGQWVAVREGRLVGFAPALRDLLAKLGEEEVSVMFVPLKGEDSNA